MLHNNTVCGCLCTKIDEISILLTFSKDASQYLKICFTVFIWRLFPVCNLVCFVARIDFVPNDNIPKGPVEPHVKMCTLSAVLVGSVARNGFVPTTKTYSKWLPV